MFLGRAGTCLLVSLALLVPVSGGGAGSEQPMAGAGAPYETTVTLRAGETIEISAGVLAPSQLPPNGRIAVEWVAPAKDASLRKIVHALDPDLFTAYRAPVAGKYTLRLTAVEAEDPLFNSPRWREPGAVAETLRFPAKTPWPAGLRVPVHAFLRKMQASAPAGSIVVEREPNNSIAQAQPIALASGDQDQTIHITGGADDVEYFDNGAPPEAGDDWFQIEFRGSAPRLFTANLVLTDPLVVARLRFYTPDGKEYKEGMNENERTHQQPEEHRTEINRTLKPGVVYYLRAEANSPGYDLELRIRKPGPYTDPREAVRQAMYDHTAQVDAWLLNRPRGASVERRIRDTGSLLGTGCMSCHTQSGVWGPGLPIEMGYRLENVQNLRHLINVMYESLRPTNVLKDAANNTSLAPLDLGDGPAGTRVAGFNVVSAERIMPARRLHARQQIRTANFVLQSNDPSGVNAAGPGSNVGQAVVYRFTAEILKRAWEDSGDMKYFDALEEKAQKMLAVAPKYSDDLAHRIEFFKRVFPAGYLERRANSEEAQALVKRAAAVVAEDEKKLLSLQREDGAFGFAPNSVDPKADPAPTALAISAFHALGYPKDHPAAAKAVKALLAMQDPYGRWNRAALTGFVTTSYAMHALARYYPEDPARAAPQPPAGDSELAPAARFRDLTYQMQPAFSPDAAWSIRSKSPFVRYWAMMALGAAHDERGVPAILSGLGDPVKMVREAARWALRQTLLDDKGWDYVAEAAASKSDLAREQLAAALIMRADATSTNSNAGLRRVAQLLARMMNGDPHPGVRAWSTRAAWNWWIWNPPVRETLNAAFVKMLEQPESSVLAENARRYQAQALFIANGHRANGSVDHQYPELAKLFATLSAKLDKPEPLLVDRIVGIAGTYYSMAGGDGGPGQMGYVTENASDMVGKAVLAYWDRAERGRDQTAVQLAVEAAANAAYKPLQTRLLDFAVHGPEKLKTIAATSVSDPRIIALPGTQEFLEPLLEQIQRGAMVEDRRDQLSKPVFRLFARARWNIPNTEEQQKLFFQLMIPKLSGETTEPQWYLAEQFGTVFGANPEMRTGLADRFPQKFATPVEELLWLPTVSWIATLDTPVPELGTAGAVPPARVQLRERAIELFVRQLRPAAEERNRTLALRMAAQAELRRDPRVTIALAEWKGEPGAERLVAANYQEALQQAIASDKGERKPAWNAAWQRNFDYFRDHVVAEMNRPSREDELACFGCHGVAGRVPSMELAAPERGGFLSPRDAWKNYRILMERINEGDVATSKLLRKPLNVQTGKEDGHQGGRRYSPGDRGYEIIRRWAHDVAALRQAK